MMGGATSSNTEPRVPTLRQHKSCRQRNHKRTCQHDDMPSYPTSNKRPRLEATKISFFTLPRELRDQIYHETWRTKAPLTVQCDEYRFVVDYEDSENTMGPSNPTVRNVEPPSARKKRILPKKSRSPWFLANKQFMHEAIYQLQSKSHWRLQTGEATIPIARKPQLLPTKTSSLLNPWDAKSLVLTDKYAYCTMSIQANGKVGAVLSFADAHTRYFQGLRALAPRAPRLRHLYVNFGVSSQSLLVLGRTPPSVDFSALKHLGAPNLQQVQFTVILPKGDKFDEGLKDQIKAETGSVGKEILGGGGKEDFIVVSPPGLNCRHDPFFRRKLNTLVWKHIVRKT